MKSEGEKFFLITFDRLFSKTKHYPRVDSGQESGMIRQKSGRIPTGSARDFYIRNSISIYIT
jgi:hypothetical protein